MSTPFEERLIEILTELQSDIRQIKRDLHIFLQHQPKASSQQFPISEAVTEATAPDTAEDILRYLYEKRGEDFLGSD